MIIKHCPLCGEDKPLSAFGADRYASDCHRWRCKECIRKCATRWIQELRKRNREFIGNYLSEHPCVDCGETRIPVLDFDHISNTKRVGVFALVAGTYSIEAIKEEISKCEVRCANCHRMKSAERQSSGESNWRWKWFLEHQTGEVK